MQYESDECQAAAAVLTRLDEVGDLRAEFVRRPVPDETTGALENPPLAQRFDLGVYLLNSTAEPRRETFGVEDSIGVPVEEHQDVPRQERTHMTFDKLYHGGPQDPLEVIHG